MESVKLSMKIDSEWIIVLSNILLITLIIKVGLSPSKKNCVIYFIDSPLKILKKVFYFIIKALFVLKIFEFLP